ncbi:MAG: hypothetical protein R2875_11485 [Desulfobacterales bacterium]
MVIDENGVMNDGACGLPTSLSGTRFWIRRDFSFSACPLSAMWFYINPAIFLIMSFLKEFSGENPHGTP